MFTRTVCVHEHVYVQVFNILLTHWGMREGKKRWGETKGKGNEKGKERNNVRNCM